MLAGAGGQGQRPGESLLGGCKHKGSGQGFHSCCLGCMGRRRMLLKDIGRTGWLQRLRRLGEPRCRLGAFPVGSKGVVAHG